MIYFSHNTKNNIQPNFTAKAPEIRLADHIMRQTYNSFPRISPTRISNLNNAYKFPDAKNRIYDKLIYARIMRSMLFDEATSFEEKINAIITPLKSEKIGNCAENAQLTHIAFWVNGIKDCLCVNLSTRSGKTLDHSVLYVNNNGKPFIVDPWAGFVDYLQNAYKKYLNEFRKTLQIPDSVKKLTVKPNNSYSNEVLSDKCDDKKLKEIVPELVLKKGSK